MGVRQAPSLGPVVPALTEWASLFQYSSHSPTFVLNQHRQVDSFPASYVSRAGAESIGDSVVSPARVGLEDTARPRHPAEQVHPTDCTVQNIGVVAIESSYIHKFIIALCSAGSASPFGLL